MFAKSDVNGKNENPIYTFLKSRREIRRGRQVRRRRESPRKTRRGRQVPRRHPSQQQSRQQSRPSIPPQSP